METGSYSFSRGGKNNGYDYGRAAHWKEWATRRTEFMNNRGLFLLPFEQKQYSLYNFKVLQTSKLSKTALNYIYLFLAVFIRHILISFGRTSLHYKWPYPQKHGNTKFGINNNFNYISIKSFSPPNLPLNASLYFVLKTTALQSEKWHSINRVT